MWLDQKNHFIKSNELDEKKIRNPFFSNSWIFAPSESVPKNRRQTFGKYVFNIFILNSVFGCCYPMTLMYLPTRSMVARYPGFSSLFYSYRFTGFDVIVMLAKGNATVVSLSRLYDFQSKSVRPNGIKEVEGDIRSLIDSSVDISPEGKEIRRTRLQNSQYKTFIIKDGKSIQWTKRIASKYFQSCIGTGETPRLLIIFTAESALRMRATSV